MNNGNLAPIRLITVGKSSNVNNMLEVIMKFFEILLVSVTT